MPPRSGWPKAANKEAASVTLRQLARRCGPLSEATSALDSSTEEAVIEAIDDLPQALTVIMIAHRLSTVQRCDRVILLEQGSISADGSPRLLLAAQA